MKTSLDQKKEDQHSPSLLRRVRRRSRAIDVNEPKSAAVKQQLHNATSQSDQSALRWTRNEYQALADRALREYTTTAAFAAAVTRETEAEANARDSTQRGGDDDKGTDVRKKHATAVDTDPLDRKPAAAQSRLAAAEQGQTTVIPQDNDVLFGRGSHEQNHTGNHYLRTLCDEQRSVYNFADRPDQTEMTRDLVQHMASMGGRFLQFCTLQQSWVEVNEEEARLQVAHVMRHGRPRPPFGRLEPPPVH